MVTKKQKICKERNYHNFGVPVTEFEFIADSYEQAHIELTCKDCGMKATLIGDFEEEE